MCRRNCSIIVFGLLIATLSCQQITIIHDGEDSVVFPLIQALNVSLVFYKDVYHIKQKLEMNVIQLDGNSSVLDDNLMHKSTDFIISLTKDHELQQRLLQTTQNLNIPTIQTQLQPWDGSYKENDQITVTDNYVIMVPSYIVFDNMLYDYIKSMNITSETIAIYDEKYLSSMEYDWKSPYMNLSVPIDFQLAEKTSESITAHLNQLEQTAKVLLFITDTKTVENYVLAGQKQIEAGMWQWLVFTKDTLPFRCSKCNNVQLHWARVVKSTSSEELSNFSDFVWSEELENQFLFSRNTYNHLQTSYCLDIVYTAIEYLIGLNATFDNIPEGTTTPAPVEMDVNITVKILLERSKDYDFGSYEHHYAHWYYQVTNAIIVRIDRMARFPDAKFSKHQEPFIETGGPKETFGYQGYCIDLLEMIRQDLNFTYDLYLVPDGKFGAIERTGNWNGMIGQLVSGEADIALGPISVIAERESDIDFTVSFYDLVGTTILMKRTEVEYSLFKFLMVLEWPVWLCILGAYLFTSILLWVFDRFSPYSYTNNREKYKEDIEKREFTLRECLWFCISLDDLSKQYKVMYAPLKGGATETYFQRMAEIEEQFYKYVRDAMEIKYATLTNCKLQPIGQEFSRKPYAIAVQEGSRLRGEISSSILRLLNERKLESLKERWWHQNPKRQECPNSEEESTGISIQNIGGVFILILGGIIISLTMLVVEFFYYKHQEKKNVLNAQKDGIRMSDSLSGRSLPDTDISATTASVNNGMIGLHRVNSPNGSIR
ncbi:Protein CBR-GLR-7 [Aphelenchoides besseyi]|nr:Protein CBR-GLR-7 [Aphelenchoides besseyi]